MEITISLGVDETQRAKAADLYYTAFRQKLHPIFRDEARGRAVLERSMDLSHAIGALGDGELVGIAGFQDADGALLDLTPGTMIQEFGILGGWWRLLALALFSRRRKPETLLMDGIVVDADARGAGIGSKLLDAVIAHAAEGGYRRVRLDVVDTNPRAKQLYERKGFVSVEEQRLPFLKRIFGFSGATIMLYTIDGEA